MKTDFDPKEFFSISLEIPKTFNNEAGYRTAIGRIYYACHLIGIDAVDSKGWYKRQNAREDHLGLCRALKGRGNTLSQAESKLRKLIEMREHSDYDTSLEKSSERCSICKSRMWLEARYIAEDIIPKLESIKPEV
jgi:hypothetical protein